MDASAPAAPRCHCGQALHRCSGCAAWRCEHCEPYQSDDCGTSVPAKAYPSSSASPLGPGGATFVVIGATSLARRVCAALGRHRTRHLPEPDDHELAQATADGPPGVAVLVHDDVSALRYALAVRHVHPDVPLVVCVFDRTIAEQLRTLLHRCTVLSPAELLAPTLAGLCADPATLALLRTDRRTTTAVRRQHATVVRTPWRDSSAARRQALVGRLSGQLRPHDTDARLLLGGLAGIATVLGLDWAWSTIGFHEPAAYALAAAARVIAGVGPAPDHRGHTAYQMVSTAMMLTTVGLTALLTAGLVNRMSGSRHVGILGPRAVPRSGHVLVVGLGQVGIRLCHTLLQLGIPVVGIERNPTAANLRLARSLGIPVVLAHAEDRSVLQRLGLRRARALAAMGSDERDNVAVAVAAHGAAPGIRVVLRAGENEAIAETRSLLPLGHTRDITRASAVFVISHLTGEQPRLVVSDTDCDYLDLPGQGLVARPLAGRLHCGHPPEPMPTTPPGEHR
ncbi:NAD-binding protein [Streptomyces sp. DSM 41987]|uniref:NAD-binding protein n=1 Tax=Streptomyces TaxID=1883 RepID=UPI0036118A13